jgi:hypothetical protein
MPRCPHCGHEYREEAARCPECNGDLAADPAPAAGTEGEPKPDYVPLITVPDPAEAMVIRASLEEAGIPVLMRTHGPITGELAVVAEDLTDDYAIVLVPPSRLAEARELLDALRREPPQWPPGMEPEGGEGS